jgi:hypothetical protein
MVSVSNGVYVTGTTMVSRHNTSVFPVVLFSSYIEVEFVSSYLRHVTRMQHAEEKFHHTNVMSSQSSSVTIAGNV